MVREVLTFKRFVVRIIGRWGGSVVAEGAAGNGFDERDDLAGLGSWRAPV